MDHRLEFALHWLGLAIILGAIGIAWWVNLQLPADDPFTAWYSFAFPLAYLVPGAVLLFRRSWHVVGWLLCVFAVGGAFSSDWSLPVLDNPWLALLQDLYQGAWFWFPMLALLVVFPDGLTQQTAKQRGLGRILLTVGVAALILELCVDKVGITEPQIDNPLRIGFLPSDTDAATTSAIFLAILFALLSLIWRYRSAAPIARRQFRWVLFAIVLLVLSLLIGLIGSEVSGTSDGPWWLPILVAYLFVPVSIMIAVLRYRLYDIDRIVTRTISYAVVVGLMAAVFLGVITLLSSLIPSDSDLVIAASTLAAVALFNPVRRRVHGWAERRFNRSRYVADLVIDRFAASLRGRLDLDNVVEGWVDVVAETMQPDSIGVWVR